MGEPAQWLTDRWILIAPRQKRNEVETIRQFVSSLPAGQLRTELEESLRRPRIVRAFRRVIRRHPSERKRWQEFERRSKIDYARRYLLEFRVDPKLV